MYILIQFVTRLRSTRHPAF